LKKQVLEVYVRNDVERILDRHGDCPIITAERFKKRCNLNERASSMYAKATLTLEVPEKIITLTESQLDEAIKKIAFAGRKPYSNLTCTVACPSDLREILFKDAKLENAPKQGSGNIEPKEDTVTESPRSNNFCDTVVQQAVKELMEDLFKAPKAPHLADSAIIDRRSMETALLMDGIHGAKLKSIIERLFQVKIKC
jgi:hypothetical protein